MSIKSPHHCNFIVRTVVLSNGDVISAVVCESCNNPPPRKPLFDGKKRFNRRKAGHRSR